MSAPTRVVFDCNIFIQALGAPRGPAGRCVRLALDGAVTLFVSPYVLSELREVAHRPILVSKLRLRSSRIDSFVASIDAIARVIHIFPEVFSYQRDPDDAHYVNLALAADARLIVSRDRDLLDLMDQSQPDGQSFHARFPALRILDPVAFLREVAP